MKRLRRWTLNGLTVLLLLVCLAMVGLWVRSYRVWDEAGAGRVNPAGRVTDVFYLSCEYGTVRFDRAHFIAPVRSRYARHLRVRSSPVMLPIGEAIRWTSFGASHRRFPAAAVWVHPNGRIVVDGVDGWNGELTGSADVWRVEAPLIWPALAALAVLAIATRHYVRRVRRKRRGHCVACGYDLTGNVSGVCPECGTKVMGPPVGRATVGGLADFPPSRSRRRAL